MQKLLGKRTTLQESLRQNQAAINKVTRELDRELHKMGQQENKLLIEIKKMAKLGQIASVRILAKDLVRTRQHTKKLNVMKSNFRAVALKILTFRSYNSMTDAIRKVTIALRTMNRQLQLPRIQGILREFEKQTDISNLKQSFIDEEISNAMDDEDEEEETDAVVNKILDELGLQITDQLATLPADLVGLQQPTTTKIYDPSLDDDLLKRLNKLRRE